MRRHVSEWVDAGARFLVRITNRNRHSADREDRWVLSWIAFAGAALIGHLAAIAPSAWLKPSHAIRIQDGAIAAAVELLIVLRLVFAPWASPVRERFGVLKMNVVERWIVTASLRLFPVPSNLFVPRISAVERWMLTVILVACACVRQWTHLALAIDPIEVLGFGWLGVAAASRVLLAEPQRGASSPTSDATSSRR